MSHPGPPEGLRTVGTLPEGATRLVLVRHGQGHVNVSGRIGGHDTCTGLTELGRDQAAAMAERLAATGELSGAAAIYASKLERAHETARILAPALRLDPEAIERICDLCELHPGEADGLIWEEYVERFDAPDFDADPSQPFAPGGESWDGFVERATAGLEGVVAAHPGELVVAATHAGVIEASMVTKLAGSPSGGPHRRLRLPTQHLSLTIWQVADGAWRLERYNDAAVAPV